MDKCDSRYIGDECVLHSSLSAFPCCFIFNFFDGIYVMKMARALLLASPLLLGACGEGYELVRTDTVFPYGNQRTAGSGYAYVLAKMLPEKEMNLQPVTPRSEPQPQLAPDPAPLAETKQIIEDIPEPPAQDADEIFREQQTK